MAHAASMRPREVAGVLWAAARAGCALERRVLDVLMQVRLAACAWCRLDVLVQVRAAA